MGRGGHDLFQFAGRQVNTLANVGQNSQERVRDWVSGVQCFVHINLLGKKSKSQRSELMTLTTFKKQIFERKNIKRVVTFLDMAKASH
jgi:hypothetical protein